MPLHLFVSSDEWLRRHFTCSLQANAVGAQLLAKAAGRWAEAHTLSAALLPFLPPAIPFRMGSVITTPILLLSTWRRPGRAALTGPPVFHPVRF